MEWAHQVQERLTPPTLPAWDNLEVAAYRQAGQACCGDIYDVVRLPKGPAAFVLGHAMAAGAESAILMAQMRAGFRIALLHADAPHFVLKELNWLVHDPDHEHQHPMRCATGLLDPTSGKLRYSTAGQPGMYLIRSSGEAEDLVRGKAPELGEQPQMEYNLEEAQTRAGGEPAAVHARADHGDERRGRAVRHRADPDEPGGRAEQERARDPADAGGRPGGTYGKYAAGGGCDGADFAAGAVSGDGMG